MGKWIRRILAGVLLAVFLFSVGSIVSVRRQYQADEKFYADAAMQYVLAAEDERSQDNDMDGTNRTADTNQTHGADAVETAPIQVDFERLRAVNSDVEAWIYCEGTAINYPVLAGTDNDTYLNHNYEGGYSKAGSLFVDAANRRNFADSNTIIYGHHMKDGSMFASLQNWQKQDFYEEHPVMWLLTPEQDYKVVLFSGYVESAYSDTYTIYTGPGEKFTNYLDRCVRKSAFQADIDLDKNGCYVLLSTCAYMFDNARYVLHGMLVPVGSEAGGKDT